MSGVARSGASSKLSLEAVACLAIMRPGNPCAACADTCQAGAITIDTRAVVLDLDACTDCGRCVPACPTGALSLADFLPEGSPGRQANGETVFECARVAPADRLPETVVVPCLGGLSVPGLHGALADGNRAALVDRGWCADCPQGGCAKPWDAVFTQVAQDLEITGTGPDRLALRHLPLASARALPPLSPRRPKVKEMSRRQLFARLTTPPPAPDRNRVAAKHPGSGKVTAPALAQRLKRLQALAADDALPGALFPALEVTGAIDLRLAAGLCPTQALVLREDTDADRLLHDPAQCLGCGACRQAGGLRLHDFGTRAFSGAETLVECAMTDCPKCLRRYAARPAQRVCDACAKDQELAGLGHGLMRRSQVPYGA